MPAQYHSPPEEPGAEIQALITRIKATFGDYDDASVYQNGTGVFVSVMDEGSVWTHEWEVSRVPGRPLWEVRYSSNRVGYYDSTDNLINEISDILPGADEDEVPS